MANALRLYLSPVLCFRIFVLFIVLIGVGLSFNHEAAAAEEYNLDQNGTVIHGYDPVAYFTVGTATQGNPRYAAQHDGVTFNFASEENMTTFMSDPAHYAPAYGGWCSYGVRVGKKFNTDPNAWKIVDERLYLQLDQGTQLIWAKDLEKNIEIADRLWPSLKPTPASILGK